MSMHVARITPTEDRVADHTQSLPEPVVRAVSLQTTPWNAISSLVRVVADSPVILVELHQLLAKEKSIKQEQPRE